jgi:hypothetical protein
MVFGVLMSHPVLGQKRICLKSVRINGISRPDLVENTTFWRLHSNECDLNVQYQIVGDTLSANELHTYSYRLGKTERYWTYSPYPILRYNRLKSGEDTLCLTAERANKAPLTLNIPLSIETPLTEKFWFKMTAFFCLVSTLLGVAFFWNVYNIRQELRLQTVRNSISGDLHDEIGSTLTAVAISVHTLKRNIKKGRIVTMEELSEITAILDDTIDKLRDTVWSINPKNDLFERLFERIHTATKTMLDAKEIELAYDNQLPENYQIGVRMEQRRHIYMMVKEIVHNTVKHSEATQVNMCLQRAENHIVLTFRDNGKGFDPDVVAKKDGNGLDSLQRRAKSSCTTLTCTSTINNGTYYKLLIPEL